MEFVETGEQVNCRIWEAAGVGGNGPGPVYDEGRQLYFVVEGREAWTEGSPSRTYELWGIPQLAKHFPEHRHEVERAMRPARAEDADDDGLQLLRLAGGNIG